MREPIITDKIFKEAKRKLLGGKIPKDIIIRYPKEYEDTILKFNNKSTILRK